MSATDDRELGVRIYDVFVGVEDELGQVPNVTDATPIAAAPAAKGKAATKPAAKAAAPVKK
jgi:hypothetical protein